MNFYSIFWVSNITRSSIVILSCQTEDYGWLRSLNFPLDEKHSRCSCFFVCMHHVNDTTSAVLLTYNGTVTDDINELTM